jgi:hyaluronate lyase
MVRDLAVKGNMTYANQANVCQELITLGILSKKGEDIQSALTNSVRVFVDATTVTQRNKAQTQFEKCWKAQGDYHDFGGVGSKKEGYWPDGTFIQHICIPYIGGYGMEMIEESSFMARILSGTSFAVPDAIIQALPALIEKTYLPAIYKGEMMLMFMGRSTTVNPFQNASHILLDCYISAKEYISDAATRRRIITACKNSILLPAYSVGFSGMSPMRDKIRYEELLAENTDDVTQSEAFSLFYPCGDRLIHQTAKYRFGLSMSSARIGKFESINSMNTNGWYTGDGMTYLYLPTDRNQYVGYFNNVNWYRLPGTTVDATNRKPESGNYGLFGIPKNQKDWVGGLHFRNRYAQAGMYLQSQISSLNARKSWFCFTDEIVCLGAGITMTEQHKAETVIENRKSGQTLNVDGQVQEKKKGAEMTHANPTYMHLEGTGGYWFPEANQSVNSYLSYDGYMMCYFNHGVAPANARYAYVLLPGMSREETEAYAAKPAITVLNNDTIVQAVLHGKDKVVGINFWQAASYIGIQSDGPASVMLQQEDEYLFIAISEPTWKRDALTLTLDGEFRLRQSSVENIVSVQSNGKKTTVTVNTKDRWGQAVELQMKGVLNIPAEPDEEDLAEQTFPFRPETEKLMRDGQLVIRTGNRLFNALGQHIE